jgi:hypothetical protein
MLLQLLFAPLKVVQPHPKKSRRHIPELGSYHSDKVYGPPFCNSNKHGLPNLFPDLAAAERKVWRFKRWRRRRRSSKGRIKGRSLELRNWPGMSDEIDHNGNNSPAAHDADTSKWNDTAVEIWEALGFLPCSLVAKILLLFGFWDNKKLSHMYSFLLSSFFEAKTNLDLANKVMVLQVHSPIRLSD